MSHSQSIRMLADNRHVFQPFWGYLRGDLTDAQWRAALVKSKSTAHRALGRQNTKKVFAVTFDRLYTLRNQLEGPA